MFDILNKYKNTGYFDFLQGDNLNQKINATESPVIYLIYILKNGNIDLVYIGKSGTLNQDGSFKKDKC